MSLVDLVSPLPLISFQQIMEEPLPPIDWVVEQLIAQGGSWDSILGRVPDSQS